MKEKRNVDSKRMRMSLFFFKENSSLIIKFEPTRNRNFFQEKEEKNLNDSINQPTLSTSHNYEGSRLDNSMRQKIDMFDMVSIVGVSS